MKLGSIVTKQFFEPRLARDIFRARSNRLIQMNALARRSASCVCAGEAIGDKEVTAEEINGLVAKIVANSVAVQAID